MQQVMQSIIELDVQNPCNFNSIPDTQDLQTWSEASLQNAPMQTLSLVIRFVDEKESSHLNNTYRKKDSPTNVLSFPSDLPDFIAELPEIKEQALHLGDLVLCESIVKSEAREQNKTLHQHWAHLVIHGVLHLQGYDHIEEEQAQIMESLEIKILQQLGFSNPY